MDSTPRNHPRSWHAMRARAARVLPTLVQLYTRRASVVATRRPYHGDSMVLLLRPQLLISLARHSHMAFACAPSGVMSRPCARSFPVWHRQLVVLFRHRSDQPTRLELVAVQLRHLKYPHANDGHAVLVRLLHHLVGVRLREVWHRAHEHTRDVLPPAARARASHVWSAERLATPRGRCHGLGRERTC
jgi:hypothetical protein